MTIQSIENIKKNKNLIIFISSDNKIFQENKISPALKTLLKDFIKKNKIDLKEQKTYSNFINQEGIEHLSLVSLGDKTKLKTDDLRSLSARSSKYFQENKIEEITFLIPDLEKLNVIEELVEGSLLATYHFNKLITDKKRHKSQFKLINLVTNKKFKKEIEETIKAVFLTRDFVNTPPSRLSPNIFLKEVKKLNKNLDLKITEFNNEKLEKKGMNCLLSVGRGSKEGSKLIILEYKPKKHKNKKPIVLVGKGITFDAGGLNLKPSRGGFLEKMKDDMAGAAVMYNTIRLANILKLDLHIVALLPMAENMLGANAYKPGDVLKSYNGKTVEVKNTDAEGRLVMADALAYGSKDLEAECMIDVATLTGASIVALGWDITPFLTNNEKLKDKLIKSSKETGEKIWQLPLDPCYKKYMQGEISDLQNIPNGMNAGVNTSAIFLSEFVGKKIPWAHFDIGGTVNSNRKSPYEPQGASGVMIRLMIDFLKNY